MVEMLKIGGRRRAVNLAFNTETSEINNYRGSTGTVKNLLVIRPGRPSSHAMALVILFDGQRTRL